MAEYISKKMVINFLCRLNEDVRFVNDMPTIDIVHCSECKWCGEAEYSTEWEHEYYPCKNMYNRPLHSSDWFCADGERRTPPIVTDEITELNEENNRLYEENEKLKAKLYKIIQIAKEETK